MEGRSQVELLEEAVETWEKQRLLREMRSGYAAVYADSRSGAEYEDETALYDSAVADGLGRGVKLPSSVARGEVWLVYFGEPEHAKEPEQAKLRPALVLSVDDLNQAGRLSFVVPITTTLRPQLLSLPHLQLNPPEGGLERPSALQLDQMKSVSRARLTRRLGSVSDPILLECRKRLCILLGFI